VTDWITGTGRKALWALVIERDGLTCHWCRKPVRRVPQGYKGPLHKRHATLDHVIPRSRGGGNEPGNIVIACRKCNDHRGFLNRTGRSSTPGLLTESDLVRLMRGDEVEASRGL